MMKAYKFKRLSREDPQIKISFASEVTDNINYLMRVTGAGTSYIVMFVRGEPLKIMKNCQDEIIRAYEDLMNGKELEVINEMNQPSQRDLETFCRV